MQTEEPAPAPARGTIARQTLQAPSHPGGESALAIPSMRLYSVAGATLHTTRSLSATPTRDGRTPETASIARQILLRAGHDRESSVPPRKAVEASAPPLQQN